MVLLASAWPSPNYWGHLESETYLKKKFPSSSVPATPSLPTRRASTLINLALLTAKQTNKKNPQKTNFFFYGKVCFIGSS